MPELNVSSRPKLRRPVLIAAFRGWNDGGQGASLAGGYLAKQWGAARFADIDSEGFFDFQATRPQVSLVDGLTRQIEWPDNGFFHAAIPGADRDRRRRARRVPRGRHLVREPLGGGAALRLARAESARRAVVVPPSR